ncbi:hypothetical protein L873DRAFT_1814789 [Choiromyces venosus 120613-1]|uniref:Uncharacterized protein n=1 Tax=Choiromyces venosus 120613-1 TaxID=1336337 RepID=A0A3N4J7D5_9PEZI|nr:hypothetical protein L873DRAFT_1814789 [Choiromyces venosus 120613-1]
MSDSVITSEQNNSPPQAIVVTGEANTQTSPHTKSICQPAIKRGSNKRVFSLR